MIKFTPIVFVVAVCCVLHLTTSKEQLCRDIEIPEIRDYYWRDYEGLIPHDAVPGGIDRNGLTTYIGQVFKHPIGSLVATIYQGKKTVLISSVETHITDKNIFILCSSRPEKFKWISTNIDKIDTITNCHLIVGDLDYDYQGNIGRVNFEEEIVIGKVIRRPLGHHSLFIPYRGREITFTHFEVLAYGCK